MITSLSVPGSRSLQAEKSRVRIPNRDPFQSAKFSSLEIRLRRWVFLRCGAAAQRSGGPGDGSYLIVGQRIFYEDFQKFLIKKGGLKG